MSDAEQKYRCTNPECNATSSKPGGCFSCGTEMKIGYWQFAEQPAHQAEAKPVDGEIELPSSIEDTIEPHLTKEEYARLQAKVPDLDLTKPWDILTAYGRACDTGLAQGLGRSDCVSLTLLWGHYAYLKGRNDGSAHLQAAVRAPLQSFINYWTPIVEAYPDDITATQMLNDAKERLQQLNQGEK